MRPLRRAGAVAVTCAALGVAVAVNHHVPSDKVADAPFVRAGVVDEPVTLAYADVEVLRVLAAEQLVDSGTAVAEGVFVIADVELRGRGGSTEFEGVYIRDRDGRLHGPAQRAGCEDEPAVTPGITTYARLCFDVPDDALAGARLVLSRSPGDNDAVATRRDDVAEVDLGISGSDAREMARTDEVYPAWESDVEKPDPDLIQPTEAEPLEPAWEG